MTKNKKAKLERQSAWDMDDRSSLDNPVATISCPDDAQANRSASYKSMFTEEIKAMLYVYGDVRHPLAETVVLVEQIVYTQACQLLVKVAEVVKMRSSPEIGAEDFLFLLRRSPGKLNRFMSRMSFLDSHSSYISEQATSDGLSIDPEKDFTNMGYKSQRVKRFKRCREFLSYIDDSGELEEYALQSNTDNVKLKRAERAEKQTRDMSTDEYMEYVKLKRIGFTTRKGPYKARRKQLKDWFDLEKMDIDTPFSEYAWDAMEYLTQETVAELIDKALLVRSETTPPLLPCEAEPDGRHLPLYASSTLVARAETIGSLSKSVESDGAVDSESAGGSTKKVKEGALNRKLALTPNDIREAMRRFQHDSKYAFISNTFPLSPTPDRLLCLD